MTFYIDQLNQKENDLACRFRANITPATSLTKDQLAYVLLEKRLLSRAFVPLYNAAAQRIQDSRLRQVVEDIIADEYQPDDHQKLLDQDLKTMGIYVPDKKYGSHQETRDLVEEVHTYIERDTFDDVRGGFFLRTYGELLPGIEYDILWPRLVQDFGLTPETSVFYWHHKVHDEKKVELGTKGSTHTDSFSKTLGELVKSSRDYHLASNGIQIAISFRSQFWTDTLRRLDNK
ncbi:hypothetical protein HYV86_00570 [Candidatus Woesearchaeota archaeon]|nr:hypothetical protein [Candidatus Woesearchaeota archaeon]